MAIPFIDLQTQEERLAFDIQAAIERVLAHGQFILGPEVQELETQLSQFAGAAHCVTCANGTDALTLVLMAEDVGPGDAVIVPSFTFVASAEAVSQRGATPVFADVQRDGFTIDPSSVKKAVRQARSVGLTPRAVIAVDLFGLPADYDSIRVIAKDEDLLVIADAAQSFGSIYKGRKAGSLADYTTTSFFPAKPLGCYGDGGAVFTQNPDKADLLRSLRFHGKGSHKYDHLRIGLNSRLDTIQAAILLEKLKIFPDELARRNAVAERYKAGLLASEGITTPVVPDGWASSWAQYTVVSPHRDGLANHLREQGIPTAVYYPVPLHMQPAYRGYCSDDALLANAVFLSNSVLSLPMHPYLEETVQDRIIEMLTRYEGDGCHTPW